MAWRDSLAPWPESTLLAASPPTIPADPAAAPVFDVRPGPPPSERVSGVPLEWCVGIARMSRVPPPALLMHAVHRSRWDLYQADCARVLQQHAAVLHALGWDALDLFGLHSAAPAANPSGWGLAWLLAGGEVLDVAADQAGLRRDVKGARMVVRRIGALARREAVAGWDLLGPGDAG